MSDVRELTTGIIVGEQKGNQKYTEYGNYKAHVTAEAIKMLSIFKCDEMPMAGK